MFFLFLLFAANVKQRKEKKMFFAILIRYLGYLSVSDEMQEEILTLNESFILIFSSGNL